MRALKATAAGGLVLVAAYGAQAWAASRGHSLGGLGLIAFAALGAVAVAWARRSTLWIPIP